MTWRLRRAVGRSDTLLGTCALLLAMSSLGGCDGGPELVRKPASGPGTSMAQGENREGRAQPPAPLGAPSDADEGAGAREGVPGSAEPAEDVVERDGVRLFRGETAAAWVEKLRRLEEREAAARALQRLRPSDAASVEALLAAAAAAEEKEFMVCRAIADALAGLVPAAEPQLVEAARSGSGRRRLRAIEALGRAASVQESTLRLLEELSAPTDGGDVVMTAAEALGRRVLGEEPTGDALRAALGDPRWAVRQRAVLAIYGDRKRMPEFEADLLRAGKTESDAHTRGLIRTTLEEIAGMRPPPDAGGDATPVETVGPGVPTRPGAIDPSPEKSPLVLTIVPRDGAAGTPVELSSRAPVEVSVEVRGARVRDSSFPRLTIAAGETGCLHVRVVRLKDGEDAGPQDVLIARNSSSFDFSEAKSTAGIRLMIPEPLAATHARAREALKSMGFVQMASEEELARPPKTEAEIARRAVFDQAVASNQRNAVGTFRVHVQFRAPGFPELQAEPLVVTIREDR